MQLLFEQPSSEREASRIRERRIRAIRYAMVIEKADTSFGACVPDLPGCVAMGETEEEVRKLITDAIAFHLDGLREAGDAIPESRSYVEYVDVKSAA